MKIEWFEKIKRWRMEFSEIPLAISFDDIEMDDEFTLILESDQRLEYPVIVGTVNLKKITFTRYLLLEEAIFNG